MCIFNYEPVACWPNKMYLIWLASYSDCLSEMPPAKIDANSLYIRTVLYIHNEVMVVLK